MLQMVHTRRPSYNNMAVVARSRVLSLAKFVYYVVFAWAYGLVGSCADVIMVRARSCAAAWSHERMEVSLRCPHCAHLVHTHVV